MEAGDIPYVMRTWLETLRPEFPEMRARDYYAWMRAKVEPALDMAPIAVVLHPVGEPSVIWGFAVSGGSAVHFVYVREVHGHRGYGRMLWERVAGSLEAPVIVTAMTDNVRAWKRKHPDALRYIPL
jgi:ribosomal protein S18 acetylase RimI-like enzyme